VRLRPTVLAATIGALLMAAPALGGNGGVAPVAPASPNAQGISDAYWIILGVTGAAFIVVETLLIVFLVKYRSRGRTRDVGGAQTHGHTRLEIAWTAVPVVLLAAIIGFVFATLPDIEDAPAARGTLDIKVEGHQYYWQFEYPDGAIAVDQMVVPVGKVVNLQVVSPDVIHSWWIPALGGKIDAIPGRTNRTWFQADSVGTYTGQCAELCGAEHALMTASVRAVSAAAFEAFLADHQPPSELVGKETFEGVCAKCHGFQGRGTERAPLIAGRTFDQATEQVIREGGTKMPPVGADWSDEQMQSVIDYLNATIGAGSSGS
jgi:cytochrome c oxidase subunit 2